MCPVCRRDYQNSDDKLSIALCGMCRACAIEQVERWEGEGGRVTEEE